MDSTRVYRRARHGLLAGAWAQTTGQVARIGVIIWMPGSESIPQSVLLRATEAVE